MFLRLASGPHIVAKSGVWITRRSDGGGGQWLRDYDRKSPWFGSRADAEQYAAERVLKFSDTLYTVKDALIALPRFITFTGADDETDPGAMEALAVRWPVEFGILMSFDRLGTPRYPSLSTIARFNVSSYQKSAHICGEWAREIGRGMDPVRSMLMFCHRAQVNGHDLNPQTVNVWARNNHVLPILQCRGEFPSDSRVCWLFDRSGGRGIEPQMFPDHPNDDLVGFAGGINETNALQVVHTIGVRTRNYWIDIETGARNSRDMFDIGICESICRKVYA